jgi:hypothetical protein
MSNYNLRQYRRMLDQIQDFEAHRIDLQHIIRGLKSLLALLDNPDINWKLEFQKQWAVLEEVYAVTLDKKRAPTEIEIMLVESSVRKIKRLVSQVCSNEDNFLTD